MDIEVNSLSMLFTFKNEAAVFSFVVIIVVFCLQESK